MINKYLLLLAILTYRTIAVSYAQVKLEMLWETDSIFPVPESIYFSKEENIFYVSLVNGKSAEPDGKGSIAKVSSSGKAINLEWCNGLDAPKGIAKWKDRLVVADLKSITIINYNGGKVFKKISVDTAGMFNDVTVDLSGTFYISDSKVGKIYQLKNEVLSVYASNLVNPNGLLWIDEKLYLLDSGVLYSTSDGVHKRVVAKGMAKDTDGLQYYGDGDFLASAWSGVIYFVKKDGSVTELLNTQQQKMNTADFFYDPIQQIIYVPTFYRKTIAAFKIK